MSSPAQQALGVGGSLTLTVLVFSERAAEVVPAIVALAVAWYVVVVAGRGVGGR
jgi:hypothetical protein